MTIIHYRVITKLLKEETKMQETENEWEDEYLKASHRTRAGMKKEWGYTTNPTKAQIKHRADNCKFTSESQSSTYGAMASLIPSLASGIGAMLFIKSDIDFIEILLPLVTTFTVYTGITSASQKLGESLHKRKHPTERCCHNEYVQRGLERLTQLEASYGVKRK